MKQPDNQSSNIFGTFIGLDLAWRSDRNPSGAVVLMGSRAGVEVKDIAHALTSYESVLSYIRLHASGPTVIAIDAPLVIGNTGGQRKCETAIGNRYGARDASCHTSNLTLYPNASSVSLASELRTMGFEHAPNAQTDRIMLEVYPHAALVALFDLPKIIKYKKGTVAQKCAGLRQLQARVRELSLRTPPLTNTPLLEEFLGIDVTGLKGAARKDYEDSLDALVCAYVAFFYWYWKEQQTETFGDVMCGYIVNPKLAQL